MTVPSDENRAGPYHGNNVTKVFGYGFKITDASHLRVVIRGDNGNERTLVLNTDYAVSGVGVDTGGSVTTTIAPIIGEDLTILRDVPFVQDTDLENQGAYYAETVEDALDLAVMRDQQLQEGLSRAVKIPENLDPSGLNNLVADIIRLGASANNIDIVAGIAPQVVAVANIDDEVVIVANVHDKVTIVAGIASDVTAVAAVASDIPIVAENVADIHNFADVYQGAKATDPATRNDGSALQAGDLYFNNSSQQLRFYTGVEWRDASAQALNMSAKSFVGNGVQTSFTLNASPALASNVLVWVGGVRQVPITDYTVVGTTLTLASAPANGLSVDTLVVSTVSMLNDPANGTTVWPVESIAELKALPTEKGAALLKAGGREGSFVFVPGNLSSLVTLDTQGGIYVPPSSDLTGASGAWVRKIDNEVLVSWFGSVGNDIADDTAAWQAAAKFAGGKTLCGDQGKTYNMTGELVLPNGCTLDLRNSRLNFRVTGTTRCVATGNNCRVMNGWIKNYGTGGSGVTGDYQCPVVMGQFAANVPVENVHLINLTIESDWTDGNGIFITSSSHNILIENIKFPDSPMFCGIEAHWGGSTTPGGMGFPYGITIRNIEAGNFNPLGIFISLSAAYEVSIENVQAGACRMGFHCYAGDFSNLYASATVAPLVGKNIHVKNMIVKDIRGSTGGGVWIYGQSYYAGTITPNPSPIEMNCVIENSKFYGTYFFAGSPNPDAGYGATLAYCRDVEICNCRFEWFQVGIAANGPTFNVAVVGNHIRSCYRIGINLDVPATAPEDWTIERNVIENTNLANLTGANAAMIYLGASWNIKVNGNKLGDGNVERALYGVLVSASARYPVLNDNLVNKVAAGGIAYSIGSLTDYEIRASGVNNRAYPGITLTGGTTLFIFGTLGRREGVAVELNVPSAGTWLAGDRLWAIDPSSSTKGYVCIAGGTPGTWLGFGA